jgi:phosphonopyruvate decarboxylase
MEKSGLVSSKFFYDVLVDNGITFYTGIPDSLLKNFCYYLDEHVDRKNHIIGANEGGALALAMGYHLATNKLPLVYLQNSGLGNIINPLLSLTDPEVYSTPSVLLVGWRGEPGVKDEPQHVKQGRVNIDLLKAMEVPYSILSNDMTDSEIKTTVASSVKSAEIGGQAHVLLVKKNFFKSFSSKKNVSHQYELSREQAIHLIAHGLRDDDFIVATTGLASRELYEYRRMNGQSHSNDFLVVGGMGHANQIALGLALNTSNKRIVCLDGDGATIMHLGSLAIVGSLQPKNLVHIVLNNGAHDSVGGQNTVALDFSLEDLAKTLSYKHVFVAESESELNGVLGRLESLDGPIFLEIKVKKGFRSEIGRPKSSPKDNKIKFMSKLGLL